MRTPKASKARQQGNRRHFRRTVSKRKSPAPPKSATPPDISPAKLALREAKAQRRKEQLEREAAAKSQRSRGQRRGATKRNKNNSRGRNRGYQRHI